jgi:ganglioside GM2 activator
VTLDIHKKIGLWVPIPCIDKEIGSCTYTGVCGMLPPGPCPPALQKLGIPCHCPFAAGVYKVPSFTTKLDVGSKVPSWLSDGEYKVKATATGAGGEALFCADIEVSIKV